uniref:Peptidase A1 domain-containing protein n=1 Tax=Panagrellus redivivus TaxID=6233 RepID=A0A7E4ZSQ7_PANRE
MRRAWALLIVGLVAIADGSQYLGGAPFGNPSENGMSYARKEAYEYEFDPEMYIGYNRQDNIENGTSLGASGYYIINTPDTIHIRIDQRDCKPTFTTSPKVCICIEVQDKTFNSGDCQSEPGFFPFCVDDKGASFMDSTGRSAQIPNFKSFHLVFSTKNEENLIYSTNFLGDGLHSANPNYADYSGAKTKKLFRLIKAQQTLAKPKVIPMYIFGKMDLVNTIHIKFNGCARIDYYGLVYGGELVTKDLETIKFVERLPTSYTPKCTGCACTV